MIKFENGKYIVYSEKGRIFGKYSSEKEAKKRIQQMKMFKHFKKTAQVKANLKNFFASEPSCKALGKAKKCVFGKAPKFSKKAETTFNKLAILGMSGPESAIILIRKVLSDNLVKSYAKHKGKGSFLTEAKNVAATKTREYLKLPAIDSKHKLKERLNILKDLYKEVFKLDL